MVTKTFHLPIRYFLALLWAHPILHISTIRVKATRPVLEMFNMDRYFPDSPRMFNIPVELDKR